MESTKLRILLVCLAVVVVESYPSDCADMKTKSGKSDDGEYCILIRNKLVSIYCQNMSSTTPKNYITLRSAPGSNKSQFSNRDSGVNLRNDTTVFSKIALNIEEMQIILKDFTFSTSSEILSRHKYGTARSCHRRPYITDATMSINLSGTQFYIAESVVFNESGWVHNGHTIPVNLTISPDRKVATCSVGGQCARCRPQRDKLILDLEGPSVVYAPLVTDKKMVCSFYCSQQDDCKGFLFSAALSECILLAVPPVCGTGHILKGYEYYEQESCKTVQGIITCTFTDIETGVTHEH